MLAAPIPATDFAKKPRRHAVRAARMDDGLWCCAQLKEFSETIPTKVTIWPGIETAIRIMGDMINHHYVLISESQGVRSGIIGAFQCHHPFNPGISVLNEAFWWVPEQFRLTRVGYLLLREYTRYGRENFDVVTLTLDTASNVSDASLEKLGYRQFEKNYSLEV